MSGIPLQPTYHPEDLAARGWTYEGALGAPGQHPFTRGPHATMYRGKPWTMRCSPSSALQLLLDSGQTGLSTAFDMPPDRLRGTLQNDMLEELIAQRAHAAVRGQYSIARSRPVAALRLGPVTNPVRQCSVHEAMHINGSTDCADRQFSLEQRAHPAIRASRQRLPSTGLSGYATVHGGSIGVTLSGGDGMVNASRPQHPDGQSDSEHTRPSAATTDTWTLRSQRIDSIIDVHEPTGLGAHRARSAVGRICGVARSSCIRPGRSSRGCAA